MDTQLGGASDGGLFGGQSRDGGNRQGYPRISDADLGKAIAGAYRCQQEWIPSTTTAERAALIRRVGELHVSDARSSAQIIVREMGKPIEQALGEVDFCRPSTTTTPTTPRS